MKKLSLQELNRPSLSDYKSLDKLPVTIVLDNIRSGHNVGSIFRTADAFLIERIIICGYSAKPPHREVLKTALGATESVEWMYMEDIVEALIKLKEKNRIIYGIEQVAEPLWLQDIQLEKQKDYVFVLGNEVNGISDVALPYLDACVELPQFGTKHSLNVGVCAGMVIWEAFKQLKK